MTTVTRCPAVLWTTASVIFGLAYGLWALRALGTYGDLVETTVAGLFTAPAVAQGMLAAGLRHGRDNRTSLTVLGAIQVQAVFPLVLVVPAAVLQYLPPTRRWFALPPAA